MSFSDYIVYVDESGDHGLENINPYYPIFVLAFCIFKKTDYVSLIVPAFQSFKFNYWGHDAVVLHEHEIRKSMGFDYSILNDAAVRASFMCDLNKIVETEPFHVIATVLNKDLHRARYAYPAHPYHLSLEFCLERLRIFLDIQRVDVTKAATHLIFESRGRQEDIALELEFRRLMDKPELRNALLMIKFVPKKCKLLWSSIG